MNKEDFLKDLFSQELKPAIRSEPKTLVVYSFPKQGKSTIVAGLTKQLNGKAKILCNEKGGYDGLNANVKYTKSFKELITYIEAFRDEPHDFTHLIIDGLTKLQEDCMIKGTLMYMSTAQGKAFNRTKDGVRLKPNDPKWEDASIVGNGFGWRWQREALIKLFLDDIILQMPEHLSVILIGHVKDNIVEEGVGTRISKNQIDLVGKNSQLLAGRVDAIAMLKRKGKVGLLNFNAATSEGSMGSRYGYLQGEIEISELLDNGEVITKWENVYPSIKNNKQ